MAANLAPIRNGPSIPWHAGRRLYAFGREWVLEEPRNSGRRVCVSHVSGAQAHCATVAVISEDCHCGLSKARVSHCTLNCISKQVAHWQIAKLPAHGPWASWAWQGPGPVEPTLALVASGTTLKPFQGY